MRMTDESILGLFVRLEESLHRLDEWLKPLRHARAGLLVADALDRNKRQSFCLKLAELAESLKAEYDPFPALNGLLDELCERFLSGDDATRFDIRAFVRQLPSVVGHVERYAEKLTLQIRSIADTAILVRALAAVSIANCGIDYRNTLTTLANLYVGAEEAGIDPLPQFNCVADLSIDAPAPGGCESVAKIMRGIDSYAVVRERRLIGTPYPSRLGVEWL